MISATILNVLLLTAPIAAQSTTVMADSSYPKLTDQEQKELLDQAGENNDFNVDSNVNPSTEVGNFTSTTASGKLGDVDWEITADGVLHIKGGQLPANADASPFSKYAANIKNVSFDAKTIANAESASLFSGLKNLENIVNPENFDTSNVTDMSGMFANTGLKDLSQVGKLNVNNVTKMDSMFLNTPITDLTPISNWNVSKIKSTNGMFSGSKITSVKPLASWDTSSLESANEMFSSTGITSLDGLQNWKTDNLKDISVMFYNTKVSDLTPISNWNVSKVSGMTGTFAGTEVSDLTPLSKWDTNAATNMSNMFTHTKVSDVTPISNWNTANVTEMYGMLSNTNLKKVTGLNWDLGNVQDISGFLSDNKGLENVDLSSVKNASNMTDISEMFSNDPALENVDLSSFDTNKVDTSDDFFTGDNSLNSINFGDNFKLNSTTIDLPVKEPGKNWTSVGGDAVKDNTVSTANKVSGVYNFDGTPVTGDLTIKTNLGEVKVSEVKGNKGAIVTVNVPQKKGYKSDVATVTAKVNQDGTVTTDDYVRYTSDGTNPDTNTNNNSGHTQVVDHYVDRIVDREVSKPNIVNAMNLVSTHFDQGYFTLYNLEGNEMVKSSNRALAKGTDWASDKRAEVNGVEYYRVATNEWLKASDVYVYNPNYRTVTVRNNKVARLVDADNNLITNRALGGSTKWRTDRVTGFNNKTYYRVATNEFVSIDDID